MRRWGRVGYRLKCGVLAVAAAAVAVGAVRALARMPARPAPVLPVPAADAPEGPGSLSGVWVKTTEHFGSVNNADMYDPREQIYRTAEGTSLPLQPWAAAVVERRIEDAEAGRPYASLRARCLPTGVPNMSFALGPIQILETPGQVTILREEFTFYRIIRLNAQHVKNPAPSYMGDAVGHWEGDTLVVDTIGLTDRSTIKEVIPHSEALHVIERYRRIGKDSLEVLGTIEDPKTFTRRWTMEVHLRRLHEPLTEYYCENNRNTVDASGHVESGVLPQSQGH